MLLRQNRVKRRATSSGTLHVDTFYNYGRISALRETRLYHYVLLSASKCGLVFIRRNLAALAKTALLIRHLKWVTTDSTNLLSSATTVLRCNSNEIFTLVVRCRLRCGLQVRNFSRRERYLTFSRWCDLSLELRNGAIWYSVCLYSWVERESSLSFSWINGHCGSSGIARLDWWQDNDKTFTNRLGCSSKVICAASNSEFVNLDTSWCRLQAELSVYNKLTFASGSSALVCSTTH